MFRKALFLLPVLASTALAGPFMQPGDLALRHDIQRLADYGVVSGTTTTWPLAWGPVLDDIRAFDSSIDLPIDVQDAIARVRARGDWESGVGNVRFKVRASAAVDAPAIRSFQDTPREDGEISAGVSWTGERFSVDISATAVSNPSDEKDLRADQSQVSIALGNLTLAASTLDRWWGPAWDSSLVLSNNARPIPAITLDRRYTHPFDSKWLSWLGPWDMSLIWGQLERERAIPNARFLGFRFNFRPIHSLEIGISRTAQWCGDSRPCDASTFWDLLVGRDNRGDDNVTLENEPGNQTAGLDFRWSVASLGLPLAFYGQFMAEDEAGGFPSRYLGQLGVEGSGYVMGRWSYRWYVEASSTSCDFWKTDEIFDCGYNHKVYESGYRYYGRVIGHAVDNDARIATIGLLLLDAGENSWQGYLRNGRLNRGGQLDAANSLTPLPQDVINIEIIHNRPLRYGRLELGLGYDKFGGNIAVPSSNDVRAFIQWRSDL